MLECTHCLLNCIEDQLGKEEYLHASRKCQVPLKSMAACTLLYSLRHIHFTCLCKLETTFIRPSKLEKTTFVLPSTLFHEKRLAMHNS